MSNDDQANDRPQLLANGGTRSNRRRHLNAYADSYAESSQVDTKVDGIAADSIHKLLLSSSASAEQPFTERHAVNPTNRKQGTGMTSQRTRDRLAKRLYERGIHTEAVLEQIRVVPRHMFMDEALSHRAYEDTALPIGHGQTISQPYIVARMTENLLGGAQRLGRVLEVGTGSGYQAAVLAGLCDDVYTVERVRALFRRTRSLFRNLDMHNVHCSLTDGSWGWPEAAPFDAIIVTAAAPKLPVALLEQLAVHGRMIIPVGEADQTQQLLAIHKTETGYEHETLEPVRFVPFLPDTI